MSWIGQQLLPAARGRGYSLVAVSLIALAALYPILDLGTWGLVIWTASFCVLLATLASSQPQFCGKRSHGRALHSVALLASVAAVVCYMARADGHGWMFVTVNGLILVYLVMTTAAMARAVFASTSTSQDVLFGAACVYVLLGLTWTYAYHVLHGLGLTTPLAQTSADPAIRHADFLYFSFVTLSTVGYGDITPDTLILRVTAASEAIAGQIFLTILVARVVARNVGSQSEAQ